MRVLWRERWVLRVGVRSVIFCGDCWPGAGGMGRSIGGGEVEGGGGEGGGGVRTFWFTGGVDRVGGGE